MAVKIVLVFVFSLLVITPRAAGTAVLDVDGDEVRRGQLYYVVSVMRPGGGLGLVPRNKSSCPLFVAQVSSNSWRGEPVAFFPENPRDGTVQEGRTLYAMFPRPTKCSESTVWKVDTATGYVTTGGTMSTAVGPHDSRFAVRKVEEYSRPAYQIEVCPCSVGVDWPSCRAGCRGTIRILDNINRPILFVKVKEQETSMIRSAVVRPN